ncbi:hypothetical protein CXG81DRAFT_8160, partial [Caulochytrium protostelioides]
TALLAGAFAGGVEGLITFPTEYIKTLLQLPSAHKQSAVQLVASTFRQDGIRAFYRGAPAMVAGNTLKAAVRFGTYERLKAACAHPTDGLTPPRIIAAGIGAGILEGLLVVTPAETVKTRVIEDARRSPPRYGGSSVAALRHVVRSEGVAALWRGTTAVVLRQGGNGAVRLSVYGLLKERAQRLADRDGAAIPWHVHTVNGLIAGVATVFATQPLDVIKTGMQSTAADGSRQYTSTWACVRGTIAGASGPVAKTTAFWAGATPRLVRLSMSGSIAFTCYE